METYKVNHNQITDQQKKNTEEAIIECFIRGLKPEIESRIDSDAKIADLVKEAIKIERQIETRLKIRRSNQRIESSKPRRIATCATCKKDNHETKDCYKNLMCTYCHKTGHTADKCYKKAKDSSKNVTSSCQLCQQIGHSAKNCSKSPTGDRTVCQYCDKPGHTASICKTLLAAKERSANKPRDVCQYCQSIGHTAKECRKLLAMRTEVKECTYCKNKGHTVQECRKLKYRQEQEAKNERVHSQQSATGVNSMVQKERSQDANLLAELIPDI